MAPRGAIVTSAPQLMRRIGPRRKPRPRQRIDADLHQRQQSTLSRNLHRLTSLLRQGSVRAAQEYREMLDTVADDVREHLTLASAALADLRPRHSSAPAVRDLHE